jgi:hypothetical protein
MTRFVRHVMAVGMIAVFMVTARQFPESVKWMILAAFVLGRYYLPYGSGVEGHEEVKGNVQP